MGQDDQVPTDADPAPPGPARGPVRFAGLTLDPRRASLIRPDGGELALRPKSYALLSLLAANAGRLVDRDAIMDAVWPDVTVTDDSITQCVGEIRRALAEALGEAGPRLLRTMPRRGYLLDVAVEAVPSLPDLPVAASLAAPTSSAKPAPAARRRPGRRMAVLGAAAAVVLAVLGAAVFLGQGGAGGAGTGVPAVPSSPRAEAQRLYAEGQGIAYRTGAGTPEWLEARALFERAVEADPTYARPYSDAVFTYTNVVLNGASLNPEADLRRAQALAERAIALAPGSAASFNARAAVLRHQGRHAEALADYRRVVELSPDTLPALANTGWMQVLLGRPEEAAGPVRAALARGPNHAFVATWNTYLGIAEMLSGAPGHGVEALRLAEAGRGSFMDHARLSLHLAAALALEGDTAAASAIVATTAAARPELGREWFEQNPLSRQPDFMPHQRTILRGLDQAGLR